VRSSGLARPGPQAWWTLPAAVTIAGVVIAGGAVAASQAEATTLPAVFGALVFGIAAVALFLSERLGWSCVAVGVYLGVLDGFLKLKTGTSAASAARDVLIYAVAVGWLARASLRGTTIRLPPFGMWVLAYTALVLVQLANPGNVSLSHSVAALKPDLEFVPLFFLGYAVLQTVTRLRTFFVLLLVCAVANGAVAFVQLNLTTSQLASWGPGYAAKVQGTGDVSGRSYVDDAGEVRTRPFGLGGDAGAGALAGVISVGAALAVLLTASQGRMPYWTLLLTIGPPLALVTGQGRTALVAGVVAALVFTSLAVTARRLVPSLAAVLLALALVMGTISVVGGSSSSGVFDRYKTIKPNELVATTQASRGKSLTKAPGLAQDHPLGAGLGLVGPAAGRVSSSELKARGVDGETAFNYLIVELGIPGLLLLFAFNVRMLARAYRVLPRMDPVERTLVSGLVAGLAGIFIMWISGAPLAISPTAPYFWFAAGGLGYWLWRPQPATGDGSPSVGGPVRRSPGPVPQ
jgi:hypothetical protein